MPKKSSCLSATARLKPLLSKRTNLKKCFGKRVSKMKTKNRVIDIKNKFVEFSFYKSLVRKNENFYMTSLRLKPLNLNASIVWDYAQRKQFHFSLTYCPMKGKIRSLRFNEKTMSRYKFNITKFFYCLNPMPCYVYFYGRDCDNNSMVDVKKYPFHFMGVRAITSFKKYWEEGPCQAYFISKKEYLNNEEN